MLNKCLENQNDPCLKKDKIRTEEYHFERHTHKHFKFNKNQMFQWYIFSRPPMQCMWAGVRRNAQHKDGKVRVIEIIQCCFCTGILKPNFYRETHIAHFWLKLPISSHRSCSGELFSLWTFVMLTLWWYISFDCYDQILGFVFPLCFKFFCNEGPEWYYTQVWKPCVSFSWFTLHVLLMAMVF